MGAVSIQDAFWGDAGKGVVSAWIALYHHAKMVLRGCGGSGAEHGSFIGETYFKTNQLPLGFILEKCSIGIGPGTTVDPIKLMFETKKFGLKAEDVRVDFKCPIITQEDIDEESRNSNLNEIGSTKSGSGIALANAVLRTAPVAKDIPELRDFLEDIPSTVNRLADEGTVVLESSQGTGLSRFFGDYPHTTAGDVTTCSVMAGVGLNWMELDDVILVVKALPTREGTGPMGNVEEYSDEEKEELNLIEYSSIVNPKTGKHQIRRKAKGIDWDLLERASMLNGATAVALTFVEQYDSEVKDATRWGDVTNKVKGLIKKVERVTSAKVILLNTGKQITSMVGVGFRLPKLNNSTIKRLQSYL